MTLCASTCSNGASACNTGLAQSSGFLNPSYQGSHQRECSPRGNTGAQIDQNQPVHCIAQKLSSSTARWVCDICPSASRKSRRDGPRIASERTATSCVGKKLVGTAERDQAKNNWNPSIFQADPNKLLGPVCSFSVSLFPSRSQISI